MNAEPIFQGAGQWPAGGGFPTRYSLMSDGMDVLPIFEEMQTNGMPVSRTYFEELSAEMRAQMVQLGSRMATRYNGGASFNPASDQQVEHILHRRGLRGLKKTDSGRMSTGKKSIEYLRNKDPFVSDLFDWRERQHIKDSFCTPILTRIPPGIDYGTLRCELNTTRVATRRLSSKNPNLLAMPTRTKLGMRVRAGFRVRDGEAMGSWDLSQIEMRLTAHETQDPILCKLFREGADIHTMTAATIFGIRPEEVDKMKHRLPAKNAGFGVLYGISGDGLLTQLRMLGIEGWTEESCQKLIDDWLNLYSGVKRYIAEVQKTVRKDKLGMVRDPWGMPRYLPGIFDRKSSISAEAGRQAVNHRIQGGAQGMIQNSMRYLRPIIREMQSQGFNVKWRLQVHDELILTFDEHLWDVLNPIMLDALANHSGIKLSVPVEASGSTADNWAGLK